MSFRDLVIKNRSCREFVGNIKIPHDSLIKWIDNARLTPSTVNLQPLKYIIADKDEDCAFIRGHVHFAGMLKDYSGPSAEHSPAAYILIITDKNIAPNPSPFDKDVGIAAQTILLSAVEEGYGGCMMGAFDNAPLCEYYSLSDMMHLSLVLALGKPDDEFMHITLEEPKGEDVSYYRTGNIHHVPKRKLQSIIIEKK